MDILILYTGILRLFMLPGRTHGAYYVDSVALTGNANQVQRLNERSLH